MARALGRSARVTALSLVALCIRRRGQGDSSSFAHGPADSIELVVGQKAGCHRQKLALLALDVALVPFGKGFDICSGQRLSVVRDYSFQCETQALPLGLELAMLDAESRGQLAQTTASEPAIDSMSAGKRSTSSSA